MKSDWLTLYQAFHKKYNDYWLSWALKFTSCFTQVSNGSYMLISRHWKSQFWRMKKWL